MLPRYKSIRPKNWTKQDLEKATRETILFIIDLCLGNPPAEGNEWFYQSFLYRKSKRERLFGVPEDLNKVREKLQSAWWIEEDDIKQQIAKIIIEKKISTAHNIQFLLARNMVKWLIEQRVFSRQTDWESKLPTEETEWVEPNMNLVSLASLCTPHSDIFYTYLFYLKHIVRLTERNMCDIVSLSPKILNMHLKEL